MYHDFLISLVPLLVTFIGRNRDSLDNHDDQELGYLSKVENNL